MGENSIKSPIKLNFKGHSWNYELPTFVTSYTHHK